MTHALRVLEFDSILRLLAGQCETDGGARAAEDLAPSFERAEVEARLKETHEARELLAAVSLPGLGDVGPFGEAAELASKGARLDGATLWRIGRALRAMRQTRRAVAPHRQSVAALWRLAERLPELSELERELETALDSDGSVLDAASTELAQLRRRKAQMAQRVIERIQKHVSSKRDLLSDPIYTQRDGRYVIPVKSENRAKVKGIVHGASASGMTLYIEPEDVLEAGNALREIEASEQSEVERILGLLSGRVGERCGEIAVGIDVAHRLDLVLAKARLGYTMRGCVPELLRSDAVLDLKQARHPLLDPETVVPLTADLGMSFDGLLITGPNTGGKTVAIKTIGLCVAMAQAGMMPPAKQMRLGVFTQLWADIGDEQSIQQSLSTFSGHIKNIAEALRHVRPGALVLIDEIGAGTDPSEGAALARAILLYLRDHGARVVASSHYGELKLFAFYEPRFTNAAMEFDVESLRPTYRLIVGAAGASHALQIAARCRLPDEVIALAREGMATSERDVAAMLEHLDQARRAAEQAAEEAERRAAQLQRLEADAELRLADADAARRSARTNAAEELESLLRELRREAEEVFEELRSRGRGDTGDARRRLERLQELGRAASSDLRGPLAPAQPDRELRKGDTVRVEGYEQVGVLLDDPKEGEAQVAVGRLKLKVAVERLRREGGPPVPKVRRPARRNIGLERAQTIPSELHIRRMRAEDARLALEKFLDDALLAGLDVVRIVHGKGEGILRQVTRAYLQEHPQVKSFREALASEGGQGVTIVTLK
jgi:DNA mismatch repair protein MutS2